MFTINDQISDLNVKERNIFKIIYSMNNHPVAAPDMSVEEARCYILFFSEGPNLTAYIGLHLPRTDRKLFYAYSSNPFPFEAAADVESEARTFAEDMGFLLDEIDVGSMAPEDRNHWIEEQHIFGYKRPAGTTEEEQDTTAGSETPQEEARDESRPEAPAEPQQKPEPVHAAVPEQEIPREPVPAQASAPPVTSQQEPASVPVPPTAQQPSQQVVATPAPGPEMVPTVPVLQQSGQPVYPPVQPPQAYQPPYPQQPYPPHPGYPAYQPPPAPQGQPVYPPVQPPQAYQPPYPQQPYPPHPGYPAYQPPPAPQGQPVYPPVQPPQPQTDQQMRQPSVEEPEAPQQPSPRQGPAEQRKGTENEKAAAPKQARLAPAAKAAAPSPAEREETVTIDHEEEIVSHKIGNPERLMEEAVRQGAVKPARPKTSQPVRRPARGVTRDKEALARLLASF